jgi:hypothetical protein
MGSREVDAGRSVSVRMFRAPPGISNFLLPDLRSPGLGRPSASVWPAQSLPDRVLTCWEDRCLEQFHTDLSECATCPGLGRSLVQGE